MWISIQMSAQSIVQRALAVSTLRNAQMFVPHLFSSLESGQASNFKLTYMPIFQSYVFQRRSSISFHEHRHYMWFVVVCIFSLLRSFSQW